MIPKAYDETRDTRDRSEPTWLRRDRMTMKLLCFQLMPELSGGSEPPVADGMNVLQGEQKCVTERIFRGHNQRVLTWQLRQCQCSHIYLFPDVRESFKIKRLIIHLEDDLSHCLQCQALVKWYVAVTPSSGTFSVGGGDRISGSSWAGNSCSCKKERD